MKNNIKDVLNLMKNNEGVKNFEYHENTNILKSSIYKNYERDIEQIYKFDMYGNPVYYKDPETEYHQENTYIEDELVQEEKVYDIGNYTHEKKVVEDSGNKISYYTERDPNPDIVIVKEDDKDISLTYSKSISSSNDGKIEQETYKIDDNNSFTSINRYSDRVDRSFDPYFGITIENKSKDTICEYVKGNDNTINMNEYDKEGKLIREVQYFADSETLVSYDNHNNINLLETKSFDQNFNYFESIKCKNIYDEEDRLSKQIINSFSSLDHHDNDQERSIPENWYEGTNGSLFK